MNQSVYQTNLPYEQKRQGKVRDLYPLKSNNGSPDQLLIIATDRISAYDVVLPNPVPGKGQLLTSISTGWFDFIREHNLATDHLISTDPSDLPGLTNEQIESLKGRIMIGRMTKVIPVECVVRGYIAGSGWKEYLKTGKVCGHTLPENLQLSEELAEPIFTPATKAEEGHDENIDFQTACDIAGEETMNYLRDTSIEIYTKARAYAANRGILLADTKFEFGFALDSNGNPTDEILLIDEVLTPDSSRFWPADKYTPGQEQESYDKQYVRNWLEGLVSRNEWDKEPPGPALPEDVIEGTLARYQEASRMLFE